MDSDRYNWTQISIDQFTLVYRYLKVFSFFFKYFPLSSISIRIRRKIRATFEKTLKCKTFAALYLSKQFFTRDKKKNKKDPAAKGESSTFINTKKPFSRHERHSTRSNLIHRVRDIVRHLPSTARKKSRITLVDLPHRFITLSNVTLIFARLIRPRWARHDRANRR